MVPIIIGWQRYINMSWISAIGSIAAAQASIQIGKYNAQLYEQQYRYMDAKAAQQRAVTGTAAKGEAASMLAQVGNLPPNITASIVEDPAVMIAQVDENPIEVNAAIAALPTEALVSSQMESLLGGMEDGEVPMWAKPAVDVVNQDDGYVIRVSEGIDMDFYADVY